MKPELFFGLVGAIGTDLQKVSNVLAQLLTEFGYNSTHIRLSALLDEIFPDLPKEPEELRIEKGAALLYSQKYDAETESCPSEDKPGRPSRYFLTSFKLDGLRRGNDCLGDLTAGTRWSA